MTSESTDAGRSVTSKVAAILHTCSQGDRHSLTEISRRTGLPISTTFRLAAELTAHGMLERTDHARYRIGRQLKTIEGDDRRPPSLHEWARAVMEDLTAATRSDVRLGILDHGQVPYIENQWVPGAVSRRGAGGCVPANATALGKALLAFSSTRTVEAVIAGGLRPYTARTVTTGGSLRRELTRTRLTSVAVSHSELAQRESAVAAPVFGAGGILLAALELRARDLEVETPGLQSALLVAARCLSRQLARATPGLTLQDAAAQSYALLGRPLPRQ
jgi:IclR family transcriptional regulator, acetate operon repressor